MPFRGGSLGFIIPAINTWQQGVNQMIEDNANYQLIAKGFPKVAFELKRHWGTPSFDRYLEDLEQIKSAEHRVGFPEAILMALIAIGDDHDKEFPGMKPDDKWLS